MMQTQTPPRHRKRVWFSPKFVQAMLAGHSALGLAFAALIYVVCLSGTLTVFLYEFQRWEQPTAPIVPGGLTPQAAHAAIANGYRQGIADKSDHDLFLIAPGSVTPRAILHYHDHETGAKGTWIADSTGAMVTRLAAPWTDFLTSLHIHLHLPRAWGMFLVGLTGVTLLSSLISGLLAHPRIVKDAFALRWGGARRLQEADLHNRLGVWGLPFHVAVALSGALLGLATAIVGVLAVAAYDGDRGKALLTLLGPHASEDETAAPLPDIEAMIYQVLRQKPDAQLVTINVQHAAKIGQVVHIGMRSPGYLPLANAYYFKGDGTPLGEGGFETGSVGRRILGILQPLHFGWFGGIAVKLVYGLLGLALTIVTHSGVTIWLARRRDQGRPVPGTEKMWATLVWGQPLGLAVAAVAALTIGAAAVLTAYLATVVSVFALWPLFRSGDIASATLKRMTALALVAVAVLHVAIWGQTITDRLAWGVDLALLLVALCMLPRPKMFLAAARAGAQPRA